MARADLLKRLFISIYNEDRNLFLKTAEEIISDERKKNHVLLADDLNMTLNRIRQKDFLWKGTAVSSLSFPKVPDGEKIKQIVDVVFPEVAMEDAVFTSSRIEQLQDIILEFRNWDILVSNGVQPVSKLLFYGPPGCGKTLCAHLLASELGVPLIFVRFDAVISSYLGETASNIRSVFEFSKNDSYVIFFDEFDAIGRSREDFSEHGEIKRVVNTFLQQIDSYRGHSIIIAATNFEKSLDYALWRRFDETLFFDLPSNQEKMALFNLRLRQFQGPKHLFENHIDLTIGFSYADIENICRIIMRRCILDGRHTFTKKDIESAVKKQKELYSLRKSEY